MVVAFNLSPWVNSNIVYLADSLPKTFWIIFIVSWSSLVNLPTGDTIRNTWGPGEDRVMLFSISLMVSSLRRRVGHRPGVSITHSLLPSTSLAISHWVVPDSSLSWASSLQWTVSHWVVPDLSLSWASFLPRMVSHWVVPDLSFLPRMVFPDAPFPAPLFPSSTILSFSGESQIHLLLHNYYKTQF